MKVTVTTQDAVQNIFERLAMIEENIQILDDEIKRLSDVIESEKEYQLEQNERS